MPVAAITPPRTRLTVRGRREVRSRPLVASHAPPLSIATAARGSSRATIAGAMRLLSPNQGRSSSARSGRDERPATNRTSMVARASAPRRPRDHARPVRGRTLVPTAPRGARPSLVRGEQAHRARDRRSAAPPRRRRDRQRRCVARDQRPAPERPAAADGELAMLRRLSGKLEPSGVVLGSPHSGAAHLYGLIGQPVAIRTPLANLSPELIYVTRHIAELGESTPLCGALDSLGVRYLYVDEVMFRAERSDLFRLTEPPADGVRLIETGGTASVYEITACD